MLGEQKGAIMPKERIKHGDIFVIEGQGAEDVRTLDGEPTGIKAYGIHLYQVGEVLNEADTLEEHASFDIHWTKMDAYDPGRGTAQLSVSIPRDLLKRAMEDTDDADGPVVIYSDFLSRAELNRMIRLGRHVRDSAHGRDE